ncbi:UDP-glucose/GDP-mannose dehydrogenase family, UDP binding domain [compost metagenome]
MKHEYGVDILSEIKADKKYDAIVLAVSHNEFLTMDLNGLKNKEAVVYDIKACLDRSLVDSRL